MLIYLGVKEATGQIVSELKNSPSQENQIHYAMALRAATGGWTDDLNQQYFSWFNEIQSARGGMSFGGFIENIKKVAIERLSNNEKASLAEVLNPPQDQTNNDPEMSRPLVQKWTVDDLLPAVSDPNSTRTFSAVRLSLPRHNVTNAIDSASRVAFWAQI